MKSRDMNESGVIGFLVVKLDPIRSSFVQTLEFIIFLFTSTSVYPTESSEFPHSSNNHQKCE